MNAIKTQKVPIASRVPAPLALELVRLAEAGNRSVSREIWAACAEHVAQAFPGGSPPPLVDTGGVVAAAPPAASPEES